MIDVSGLIAAVTEAVGVADSTVVFIQNFSTSVSEAVAAALAADDAADQGSIDAANAAIAQETARIISVKTKLAAAITSNAPPEEEEPPTGEPV